MRRRALLSALPAAVLAGCGFALRGTPELPFRRISLQGFPARSPLGDELRRALARTVQVIDPPAPADVVFRALADQRTRSVVASTAAAQVRELQLRVVLRFDLTTPAGYELIPTTELLLSRDMSFSETFALAKEQEEAELYRAMQSDIVAQVLRRLARVKLG